MQPQSEIGMKNVLLTRLEWPDTLTPELREQLLLDKIARAQQAIISRKKLPQFIRGELNVVCCNDKECQHD